MFRTHDRSAISFPNRFLEPGEHVWSLVELGGDDLPWFIMWLRVADEVVETILMRTLDDVPLIASVEDVAIEGIVIVTSRHAGDAGLPMVDRLASAWRCKLPSRSGPRCTLYELRSGVSYCDYTEPVDVSVLERIERLFPI